MERRGRRDGRGDVHRPGQDVGQGGVAVQAGQQVGVAEVVRYRDLVLVLVLVRRARAFSSLFLCSRPCSFWLEWRRDPSQFLVIFTAVSV